MKLASKKIVSIVIALCVLFASVTCLMGLSASAEGTATNVALGTTINKVLTNGTDSNFPGHLAFDGKIEDSHKWMANGAQNGTAWIIVDLGKVQDISKIKPHINKGTSGNRQYYYDIYLANEGDFTGDFTEANKSNIFESIKANGILAAQITLSNSDVGGVSSSINLSARYVLVRFVGCNESNTVSLYELEIFSGKEDYSDKRVVACYGDSITEGMGVGVDYRYPNRLQELLGDEYLVLNSGDRGEKPTDIVSRQGGIDIFTKRDIVFQKGEYKVKIGEGLDRGFVGEDGRTLEWTAPFGRDIPIDKVTINGVTYRIKIENFSWATKQADTYLVREGSSNSFNKLTIPKNSKAKLEIASASKDHYCEIYFMGFNGGYKNVDELVAQYKMMINHKGNDNYLLVIPYSNWNKAQNEEMRKKFTTAFGRHAIDLVEYVANGGMEKAGLTPDEDDKAKMASGILPFSLRINRSLGEIHLNTYGYKIFANAVYERGLELDIFGEGSNNNNNDTSSSGSNDVTSNTTSKNLSGDTSSTDTVTSDSVSSEDASSSDGITENISSDNKGNSENTESKAVSNDKGGSTDGNMLKIVIIVVIAVVVLSGLTVLAFIIIKKRKANS